MSDMFIVDKIEAYKLTLKYQKCAFILENRKEMQTNATSNFIMMFCFFFLTVENCFSLAETPENFTRVFTS